MRLPAFQYPGGKARLRAWVIGHFPRSGRLYLEPFAGRGNVFFAAKSALCFERWHLNDARTEPFFRALLEVDVSTLPEEIDRATFERLRASPDDSISRVVEPRVTFFGKGWHAGFKGTNDMSKIVRGTGGPNVYAGRHYRPMVAEAKRLLRETTLTGFRWEALPWADLGPEDFVYLDPPYFGTDVGYGQIDHIAMLSTLIGAPFGWVLSGYDSELYRWRLGAPSATFARTDAMRVMGARGEQGGRSVECLWARAPYVGRRRRKHVP